MQTLRLFIVAAMLAVVTAACGAGPVQETHPMQSETTATHLIINFHVAQDRLDDFLPIMTGINEGMAGEEGFVSALVYRNVDDPLNFTLIEQWESRALHIAHYERIVESGAWANILTMLTRDPEMSYNDNL